MKSKLYAVVVVALIGFSLLSYSCVAVAGAGAAGGTYAWSVGKISFNTPNGVEPTHKAVLSAFEQLDITVVKDGVATLGGTLKGVVNETAEKVTVDVEPMGPDVSKVDVRIGFWGDRGRSQQIAEAIRSNLE